MKRRMQPTRSLHIFTDPADPDIVLVLANDAIPGALPVIPTPLAHAYWAHPSRGVEATQHGSTRNRWRSSDF
jgi:hypothetical protein